MMNSEYPLRTACSEEFAELCALSTAAALSPEERARLDGHLASCTACRALIAEYRGLTIDGAARMAAASEIDWEESSQTWDPSAAKANLFGQLAAADSPVPPASCRLAGTAETAVVQRKASLRGMRAWRFAPPLARALAVIVLCLLAGYYFGSKRSLRETSATTTGMQAAATIPAAVQRQLAELQSQRDELQSQRETLIAKLADDSGMMADLSSRSLSEQRALADLKRAKDALEAQVGRLSGDNRQQAEAVASLSAQRDALQRRLDEAGRSFDSVRGELDRRQKEHQETLASAARLQGRIDELSSQLRDANRSLGQHKDFLASDRDIRELMGARQLYIADVFDVAPNGKKQAPFGRIFYTKGKSLIFYAFDLDQPAGYRNAKAFQVWGSQSEDQAKPVSLGIFYKDNDANRRWIFKTEDPDALAQINAVFVTVEHNGPAPKPTGKPILYAFLRTAPTNHP